MSETRQRIISGAKLDAHIGLDDAYAAIQRLRDMLKDTDSYTAGAWYESVRVLNAEGGDGWLRALTAMTTICKHLPEYEETR